MTPRTPHELGISLKDTRPGTYRTACPQCRRQKRDDALGVTLAPDGSWVAHCFRCEWKASSACAEPLSAPKVQAPVETIHERLSPRWAAFWAECVPVKDTLGAAYLQWRGCRQPPRDGDLRFHPSAYHWVERKRGPALVALLTDAITGEPRSLHLTWITATGKADVRPARLLLPMHRKAGAVCRLWPDEAITHGLAIAEGIETALAGAHAFGLAWAAIDAGNLAQFPVLPAIECLSIFTDHDDAGIKAARQCATTWTKAGREVRLVMSERKGADLADEVLNVA